MNARHPNQRRVKIHRPYTIEDLAATLNVHKNTIRRWAKDGLDPIDDRRPMMFRGIEWFNAANYKPEAEPIRRMFVRAFIAFFVCVLAIMVLVMLLARPA